MTINFGRNDDLRAKEPMISRSVLYVIAIGWCLNLPVSAQEYTLRNFVQDTDALIVARILSKEASYMEIRTRQPDGRISVGNPIFTTYEVAITEYFGSDQFRDIRTFVLPGGRVGSKGMGSTHTPELDVGWEVLVAIKYDELNDYYTLAGISPVGRIGAVFIAKEVQGHQVFIPYGRRYQFERVDTAKIDLGRMTSEVSSTDAMLDLASAYLIDYDAFLSAIREAEDELE